MPYLLLLSVYFVVGQLPPTSLPPPLRGQIRPENVMTGGPPPPMAMVAGLPLPGGLPVPPNMGQSMETFLSNCHQIFTDHKYLYCFHISGDNINFVDFI